MKRPLFSLQVLSKVDQRYAFNLYIAQNTKISMLVNPKLLIKFKLWEDFQEVRLTAAY